LEPHLISWLRQVAKLKDVLAMLNIADGQLIAQRCGMVT
jgi:hypothetical protein